MQRRLILKSGALALFAASSGVVPMFLSRTAFAAPEPNTLGRRKVLVVVFQRFGMDGLMAVAPYADERLAALRPSLMLPRPGSGEPNARLDLDGRYGLHPSFAPLLDLYRSGQLAIVHGAGSPDSTRSHVDAQLWWESGTPGDRTHKDGWLSRALAAAAPAAAPLRAVSLTAERPRILYGEHAAAAVTDVGALGLSLGAEVDRGRTRDALRALYAAADNAALRGAGTDAFEVARILDSAADKPQRSSGYPESGFGKSLGEIAKLIKAEVGLQVAFAESRFAGAGDKGTWDTHSNEASMQGPFPTMAEDFAKSVRAFWRDLGALRDDVTLVTLTDFGRNVVENAGVGTDHGRATAMFVLGTAIRGGHVYGSIPGRFDRDALEDHIDLPVTTDFRAVVSGLTASQLGIREDTRVFPGWQGQRLALARA